MEKEVTKELKKTIEMLDKKFSKNKSVEKYEKIISEFEILVEKGLIKKRGNNILSVLEKSSENIYFNTL